jgi:alkanesulfonate monooxygenase SsuD/methylene tetrahydromethanopterin reductase-like flavin-dependent oxidoreductase (luciferase family)
VFKILRKFRSRFCATYQLTPDYLRNVIWPTVAGAAGSIDCSPEDFEVAGSNFLVWGPTAEAVAAGREQVRRRVAFYSSTRVYAPVLEHHGLHDLGPRLRSLIAENRWADLAGLVSDDVLDLFCIAGVYEEIADKVDAALEGLVDRIHLSLPRDSSKSDLQRAARALEALHTLPNARERRTARAVSA